jgi:hypothetical protein
VLEAGAANRPRNDRQLKGWRETESTKDLGEQQHDRSRRPGCKNLHRKR